MKHLLIALLFGLLTFCTAAQSDSNSGRFGVTINSSLNGELYPVRVVPSATYTKEKSQLELGVGFNPASRKKQQLLSTEFNYKFYPNGHSNKFAMYLLARASYVNALREKYYANRYHYIFANGGYGFEINSFKNLFLGTNISIGAYTYSKTSDTPYPEFATQKLFDEVGYTLAFQFAVGYRF